MITRGSLLALAGLSQADVEEKPDMFAVVLTECALSAFRAGVRLSWNEWVRFHEAEQHAFVAAGDILELSRARRSAVAQRGLAGYHAAGAHIDGGDAHDEALADATALGLARGLSSGPQ